MRSSNAVALSGSTSTNLTSSGIYVANMSTGSVVVNVVGATGPDGTVKVQASNDVSTGFPASTREPSVWVDTGATVTVNANGTFLIAPFNLSYQFIRLVYTRVASTGGVLTATFDAIGA